MPSQVKAADLESVELVSSWVQIPSQLSNRKISKDFSKNMNKAKALFDLYMNKTKL